LTNNKEAIMRIELIKSKFCFRLPGRLKNALFYFFLFFLYWMYGYRPVICLPGSLVDEGLYIKHGEAAAAWLNGMRGSWLGAYDCFLFAKAPLYGIWLGIINFFCVPVRIAEFLLLLGVLPIFAWACRPIVKLGKGAMAILAVVLIAQPGFPSALLLQRNEFQIIISMYAVAALLGFALRSLVDFKSQWPWAVFSGFMFSLCYLNREEAIWLIPAIGIALIVQAAIGIYGSQAWISRTIMSGLILGLAAIPAIATVMALNYQYYGVATTTFRRSEPFTKAYQIMTSLEPNLQKRYIPICRETRLKAYALSPTFGKLRDSLEGNASYWVAGESAHSRLNGYAPADKEFFVSNFEFCLRFAAQQAGASTAKKSEEMFQAIAGELAMAVEEKKIAAGRSGMALMTPMRLNDMPRIASSWRQCLHYLITMHYFRFSWNVRSSGTADDLKKAAVLLHSPVDGEALEGNAYEMRNTAWVCLCEIQKCLYALTLPFYGVFIILALVKRRSLTKERMLQVLCCLVPVSALLAFTLAMAVLDVVGFPHLGAMSYVALGNGILSAGAAYALVLIYISIRASWMRRSEQEQ
jgi:hypothetical protein